MAEPEKMNTDEVFLPDYLNSKHIHSIPDPVMLDILSRLNFIDRCRCSRVCQRWYSLAKDFTLKKKIIIERQLQATQFSSLVQHHFTHHLEEFQVRKLSARMMTMKKNTLWKVYKMCDNMKKLVLMSCSMSSLSLSNLPSNLVHLSIRGSEIYPNLFFSRQLSTPPPLVCLDIGGVSNFLTSEDLHVLTNLKSLRALYLEGCFRINNGGIESIIGILPQLIVLDVEGTDISNEGAMTIFNHCRNVTDLFIGNTSINDDLLSSVGAHTVPHLTNFCLRNTNVSRFVLGFFMHRHNITHGVEIFGKRKSIIFPNSDSEHDRNSEFPNLDCQHYINHDVYGLY